jgi:4a-hydroxytetrahydrobiopterin dehydratase
MGVTRELLAKTCKPCEGGVPPLTSSQVSELMPALHTDWQLGEDGKSIHRNFQFPAYGKTMQFVNAIAWIAASQGHHPDLTVGYDTCGVTYTTHAIDGLSENDFICAAHIDRLLQV